LKFLASGATLVEAKRPCARAAARYSGYPVAATYSSLVGVSLGGKYEIRRVLGAGGMGVVCEAVHVDLGKRVAIKLIDKSMKESELIVARFKREARALGQIDSEHIVEVFDVGADQRVGLYMVMEHLTGEDLAERLERDRKIDVRTAVMIGHQMARALAKAHAAGVVHRDLKPANVYLTKRDNGQMLVKLLDFGVSKIVDIPADSRITGQGSPIGTPLYMAPEQAEGKDDVDGRADIWSFGAVLYEALSGQSAFMDRGTYHNTLVGILTTRPKPLHEIAPWVPVKLAEVVDAMLVHDRNVRIKDAGAVTQRLLDVFPTVHPDGTGLHTAVIVPHTESGVADATSDTEVFTSTQVSAVQPRPTGPPGPAPSTGPSSPLLLGPPTGPSARVSGAAPAPSDSVATLGDAFPIPPMPSSSGKTMPFAPAASSSSASIAHVTSPSSKFDTLKMGPQPTPSELRPLPSAAPPPKRGGAITASILLAIVGVAVGGWVAWHKQTPSSPAAPVATTAARPPATPQPVFTEITPPPTIAPPSLEPPPPAVSAAALPSASVKPRFRPVTKLKVKPSQPAESAAPPPEPAPESEPTPAPAPIPTLL
jgi:serine/threonine-protein kinase